MSAADQQASSVDCRVLNISCWYSWREVRALTILLVGVCLSDDMTDEFPCVGKVDLWKEEDCFSSGMRNSKLRLLVNKN